MDEIKQLYEEIKDLKEIILNYNENKNFVNKIALEIDQMKEERQKIDLLSLKQKISQLEREYGDVFREIDCFNMLSSVCLSIKDIKDLFKKIEDDDVCKAKCLEYLRNLIVSYTISNSQMQKHFSFQDEDEFYRIVKVNRDIEDLLKLAKSKPFSGEIKHEIKRMIKIEIESSIPSEIKVYFGGGYIYMIYPISGESKNEDIVLESIDKRTWNEAISLCPLFLNILLQCGKENLSLRTIKDELQKIDIEENNSAFKDTNLYIENVDEWILDLVVKNIIDISSNKDKFTEFSEIHDNISGLNISVSYDGIRKSLQILKNLNSTRMEKALVVIRKSLIKFFNISECSDKKDLFVFYSDITHCLKKINIGETQDLEKLRENSFYEIIKRFSTIQLDLSQPVLVLKAQIKCMHFDFTESVYLFVAGKNQLLFYLQFFENLYSNFIAFCLKPKKYQISEKNNLYEISGYLLELSYDLESQDILNYNKVDDINKILALDIETVISNFKNNQYHLAKTEFRTLLRMFFDSSRCRDDFLMNDI